MVVSLSEEVRLQNQAQEPTIRLEHVSKVYRMGKLEVRALDDISLEIWPGEFIVFLGPSGSGKTTLLNVIGGLDAPTSGTVNVNGIDVTSLSAKKLTLFRRTEIGFVFQFFNLIPTLTAKENVEFAADLVNDHPRADELLDAVGLGERKKHFPAELSGGENQRVAIARALATNPAVMLCDEPSGSLDFETGKHIFKLLRDLNRQNNKVMCVVTHNTPIGEIADRVIRLRDGKIADITVNEHPLDPDQLRW
ncbi:MAG: ABC transporter ATP-binding protein [Dehalococcoidia bacterium]|nr:ABC transporter ATP-binding protein [Dehalococcoidia bacterium]